MASELLAKHANTARQQELAREAVRDTVCCKVAEFE